MATLLRLHPKDPAVVCANVSRKNFSIVRKPMLAHEQMLEVSPDLDFRNRFGLYHIWSYRCEHDMHTGWSSVSDTGLASLNHQGVHSAHGNLEGDIAEFKDWRKHIIDYLCDPSQKVDGKFRLHFQVYFGG
jgi:hypothetical protein